MKKVTGIFDIGKTNKKFFLFDRNNKVVYKKTKRFDELKDEDGYPCDDLEGITKWIKRSIKKTIRSKKHKLTTINFSTYGASLVHLDENGNPLTTLYNYTKPIDESYINQLYSNYGGMEELCQKTASPSSGMLNSGIQLYWLKYHRPEIYSQIKYSLHLPQYFSFLFTGVPLSDYTSIGCHTMLWNYETESYHKWVITEGIDRKLAPIVDTKTSINTEFKGKKLRLGTGIHDSSAALLPYILSDKKPFLLISTGTWNVTLNPFHTNVISIEELKSDCLNYMTLQGKPVKAARLFLGNEYNLQIEKLRQHFKKKSGYHKKISFSKRIFKSIYDAQEHYYHFTSIAQDRDQPQKTNYKQFIDYETAYHQLVYELVEIQDRSSRLALGDSKVEKIYIDGGFSNNEVFVKIISYYFKEYKIRTTKSPLGSALGAAIIVNDERVNKSFIKKNYRLNKHVPLILKTKSKSH